MELSKNRDFTSNLYDLEAKNKNRDEQLYIIRKEMDEVRFSNSSMIDRNGDLKAEIEALKQHISLLEAQNRDLNRELETFVMTDEQIRMTLNRKERVEGLRVKTENELHRSLRQLE